MSMNLIQGSKLTDSEISQNYDSFIAFLKESFSGDRLEKLLKLYESDAYSLRVATAPAAGKLHFHNAHTGGYLQHIANVERASKGAAKLLEMLGGVIDFTEEERIFAALHHDLGKLGNEDGEYFLPETEEWQIKKMKSTFKHNPNVQFWRVTDNALYILQSHQIVVTQKEVLGIKLADGMYDEENAFYLKTNQPAHVLRTNLPYVIHTGDFLSSKAEYDQWKSTQ